jgi:hypothetical protein
MAYFKLVPLRAGALLCHIDLLGSSRIQARRYLGGAGGLSGSRLGCLVALMPVAPDSGRVACYYLRTQQTRQCQAGPGPPGGQALGDATVSAQGGPLLLPARAQRRRICGLCQPPLAPEGACQPEWDLTQI